MYYANSYIKFLETPAEYSHSSRKDRVLSATCLPAFPGSRCQGFNSCNSITLYWKSSIFDASLGQLIDKLKQKGIPDSVSVLVRPDKLFYSLKNITFSLVLSTSLPDWGKAERLCGPKKPAFRKTQDFREHYQTRFPSEKGKHKILPILRSKVTSITPRDKQHKGCFNTCWQ